MNKNSVLVIASINQFADAGNDLETLGLAFHHHGPTSIKTSSQANTNINLVYQD